MADSVGLYEIPQELPTGAATAANQALEITDLDALVAKDFATQTTLAALNTKVIAVNTGATVVSSSALPTGASTSALQGTGNTSLASIDGKLGSLGQKAMAGSAPVVIASDQSAVPISGTVTATVGTITAVTTITNPVGIKGADGSTISSNANPVPISDAGGSITVDGTIAVSAIAAALPAGTNVIGHVIADTGSTTAVTGNVTVIQGTATSLKTQAENYVGGTAVSNSNPIPISDAGGSITVDGTIAFSNTTIAVTNAGTFATQATLQAGSAIVGKVGIDQTTPGTTNGVQVNAALPAGSNVIGHVIADSGSTTAVTGNVTVIQGTGTNLHTVVDSGVITSVTSITNALPAGTNLLGKVGIDQTTPGTTNLVALTAETTKVIGVVRNADGSGNLLTSTGNALDVNIKTSSITVSDNLAQVNGATVNVGTGAAGTGTQRVTTSTDSTIGTVSTVTSVTQNADVRQATAANLNATVVQGTATNLKTQAENYQGGTAVGAANPLQVTLANTGANATAVKTDGSASIQPVSGTVAVSGNVTVVQGTGTNLHTVVDSGVITSVTSITNALPAGTNLLGKVGIDQTTPGTTNKVSIGTDGTVAINTALPVGSNLIGKVSIDQTTPGTTNAVAPISGQNGVAGNDGNVDATTQRVTIAANVISSVNSSTATLAASAIFTGTSEDIMSYGEVRITVYADVASATDGLSIQQSTDNSNWIIYDTYSIPAITGKTFSVPRQARYYRIVYTNGGAAQGTFILQTTYQRIGASVSSQRPSDNYSNETDLQQEQSFLMNYNSSTNTWSRVRGDSTYGVYVNPQGLNVDYERRMMEEMLERTKIQMLNISQAAGGGNYQYEYR